MTAKFTIDGYAEGAELTTSIARDGVTYCVSVSQVGGGTVGPAHDGGWMISAMTTRGEVLYDDELFQVSVARTHMQIAYMIVGYVHH